MTTLTAAQRKTIKAAIGSETNDVRDSVFADKIATHKDGSISICKGYFYTFGETPEKWGAKVLAALNNAGIVVKTMTTHDEWRAWPKDSYFVATITEVADVE